MKFSVIRRSVSSTTNTERTASRRVVVAVAAWMTSSELCLEVAEVVINQVDPRRASPSCTLSSALSRRFTLARTPKSQSTESASALSAMGSVAKKALYRSAQPAEAVVWLQE